MTIQSFWITNGLSAILTRHLKTHFVYEGKRIVSALNELNMPSWDRSRPAFLLADDEER
ncbi:hypothetical protein [Streptomyces sp. NPDC002785]|uniref:hypothetical protein n=1 Tax=Streptomyces sp. NPDC002785 TaxID=3154543 RepID=UPI003325DCAA